MRLFARELRGLFTLCLVPASLKLHRTEVVQRRVPLSAMAAEGYPVQRGLPGLLPGGEPVPARAGRFRAAPEALGRCVAPAVAHPAHRRVHLAVLERSLEIAAAALALAGALGSEPALLQVGRYRQAVLAVGGDGEFALGLAMRRAAGG